MFEAAEKKANDKGLILVDTKFEFGKTADGKLVLIDEVLTPDSSRFWTIDNYMKTMQENESAGKVKDPEDFSKEPLRAWIKQIAKEKNIQLDDYKSDKAALKAALGDVPDSVVTELANKYATIYYALTGKEFKVDLQGHSDVNARIIDNLRGASILS